MSIVRSLRGRIIYSNSEIVNNENIERTSSSSSDSFVSTSSVSMVFDAKEARETIPKFDGKRNFAQFIAICDELHNDLEENEDDAGLVRVIKQKLNSEAFTLCRNCTTFNEISTVLSRKYGEDTPLSVLIRDAGNLRQKEFEDARAYGDRAILLQERISLITEALLKNSTLTCKTLEPVEYIYHKVILEYFINGLRVSDVRNIVKSNNLTELTKAADYAATLESNYKNSVRYPNFKMENSKQYNSFQAKPQSNIRPYINTNSDTNYSKNNKNQIFNKAVIKTEPSLQAKTVKCYFCGIKGHFESECRKKQKYQINILDSKNGVVKPKHGPDLQDIELMKSLGI